MIAKGLLTTYRNKEEQSDVNNDLLISGFSDEISSDFDIQIEVVAKLGMRYISLRVLMEKI